MRSANTNFALISLSSLPAVHIRTLNNQLTGLDGHSTINLLDLLVNLLDSIINLLDSSVNLLDSTINLLDSKIDLMARRKLSLLSQLPHNIRQC